MQVYFKSSLLSLFSLSLSLSFVSLYSLYTWLISTEHCIAMLVECVWNVMAHAQIPHFVFRQNGRVRLNRRGRQVSRLLVAEVCASAVVMLDTPCSEVVWRLLATHSIRQFPLHFPSSTSSCAITFQLDSKVSILLPIHTAYEQMYQSFSS
jgi:hypothetical protein